jgi:hypothetical protein
MLDDQCSADPSQATAWNHLLGCYVGAVSNATVASCKNKAVTVTSGPYDDCYLDAKSEYWADDFCAAEIELECKPKWFERSFVKKAVIFFVSGPAFVYAFFLVYPHLHPCWPFSSLASSLLE